MSGYGVRRVLRSESDFKCFNVKFDIVHLLVNN